MDTKRAEILRRALHDKLEYGIEMFTSGEPLTVAGIDVEAQDLQDRVEMEISRLVAKEIHR